MWTLPVFKLFNEEVGLLTKMSQYEQKPKKNILCDIKVVLMPKKDSVIV